ncbi:MAG: Ig-like domain-containing protein, partial [Oscillospiraceae bacterium]
MFKKIISMTLTILMIVSCIQITFAAELPNISISNARGNVGEKVFVDISIANNSGFDAFAIGIMYDNKYLEPVDIVTNTDLGGMDGSNLNNMDEHRNPMISYTFISADEISVSGKVATIEFKIVGTPDGGKTPLRIVKYQNNSMLANNSAEVSVATTNGEVTVGGGEEPILVTGVSLNKTETSIKKDESETLTATITPANATNKGVTWESENPEIAIVNNGEVTAKKVGSTKIIVTTADGGKKAECLVTVIENVISVTGVSLNKTAANIQNGSTETLVATIMPTNATNKGVTWKSENTEIAVVNNGEVTAKKVGDTKIVVTTIDGEKKAECHITVTRKPGGGGGGGGTIAGPKVSMPTSNLTSGEVVAGTAVELA